jgi:3-methyladenine DNA glycosylase AlkD
MGATETKEVSRLQSEIIARLAALAVPRTEVIRNVRREFSARLVVSSPISIVALALSLTRTPVVPRFFAYELIQHHPRALRSLKTDALENLGAGNNTWGEVDAFACYLAGPVWRERQVSDSLIRRWASSNNRWWRRTAVVSTVPLNNKARGGKGDTTRTLKICKMLVADRDDMVVKALSWALRELAKRDPEAVQMFLGEHGGVLAARVLREVNSKLRTGVKNPRKQRT